MNESHRQPVEYHWYQYATARRWDAVWRDRETGRSERNDEPRLSEAALDTHDRSK
jgi:hypothetical protein